uniref:NADH-ubiquinone oxidoreductase chain 1 n=1 Tax=Hammerschmidtiella sp. ZengetLiu-2016 TaxID=2025463 RepID=A0A3Q8BHA6_9BILA|nr:NADH dehydrogenase subunit 1 [Hammerschmidtiella sp. ZengetLiu-2016]
MLMIVLFIVQGVAYVTLCERHLLGGSQQRVGPNKVSWFGLVQPIFDGVKLMKKEQLMTINSSNFSFIVIPGITFTVMYLEWFVLPYFFDFFTFQFSILFFLCLMGFSVYSFLLSGAVSKSKYGMLGAVRASGQSVSYEIAFSLYIFCVVMYFSMFSFVGGFSLGLVFIFMPFFFMMLAELNGAPFDFSEGESELVSGYNVEYGSVSYALLYIGEYGSLLFFSVLMSVVFFGFSLIIFLMIFCVLIFVRSSFPRFRYDLMMGFFWFKLLPVSLFFLLSFILMMI